MIDNTLNLQQENFCKFYANNKNGGKSANLAGYKNPYMYAQMLLKHVNNSDSIQKRIKYWEEIYKKEDEDNTDIFYGDKFIKMGNRKFNLSELQKMGEKKHTLVEKKINREHKLIKTLNIVLHSDMLTEKQEKYCYYFARTSNDSVASRLAGFSQSMSRHLKKSKTGTLLHKLNKRISQIKKELEKEFSEEKSVIDIPMSMYKDGAKKYKNNPPKHPTTFKLRKGEFGYLYVLTNENWGDWVKTGMSVQIKARLSQYNSSQPTECKVLDYYLTDSLTMCEIILQQKFVDFCKKNNREFKLSKSSNNKETEWHNVTTKEAQTLFEDVVKRLKIEHLKDLLQIGPRDSYESKKSVDTK